MTSTRLLCLGLSIIILGVGLAFLVGNTALIADHAGEDLSIYLRHTRAFLAGGSFYDARQLAGPYHLEQGDSLYPPTAAILFVPFLVLPAFLWWLIPALVIGYAVWRFRPAPWSWPVLALCLCMARTLGLLIYGNPSVWLSAAVAAGLLWRWPAVFILLKPTLAPFALVGIRSPGWWLAGIGLALVSLALLPAWLEWWQAVRGANLPLTYSITDVFLVGLPLVAWAARTSETAPRG